jgi:single-strand DNA-binding protein
LWFHCGTCRKKTSLFFTFFTNFPEKGKRHARPRLYLGISFAGTPGRLGGGPGLAEPLFSEAIMNNLNSILIEGNLVRDPLLRSTPKGTSVCTFTLASNRFFRQDAGMEKEVSFFDVESWAKLAEHCYNQGHKGRGVRVVGRLKQDRWNGSDGKAHSRIAIVAEHVEFRPDFKREAVPVEGAEGAEDTQTNIYAEAAGGAEDFAPAETADLIMAVADPQEEVSF